MSTAQYDLDLLIELLNQKIPLEPRLATALQEHLFLKYNHESNAIEGNSLSRNEVKVLLENGITSHGKPFKDHLEVMNHQQANSYLQEMVEEKITANRKTDQGI